MFNQSMCHIVDALRIYTPYKPCSFITHSFFSFPTWFAGKSDPQPIKVGGIQGSIVYDIPGSIRHPGKDTASREGYGIPGSIRHPGKYTASREVYGIPGSIRHPGQYTESKGESGIEGSPLTRDDRKLERDTDNIHIRAGTGTSEGCHRWRRLR